MNPILDRFMSTTSDYLFGDRASAGAKEVNDRRAMDESMKESMARRMRDVVANPAAYGLTNVADSCFNQAALSVCSEPGEYLFWDDFHPTTRGHQILAGELAAAIPEPSTWILSLSACALLLIRRFR